MAETAFHRLAPEDPSVVSTVRVSDVWAELREMIELSPARDLLVLMYAETECAANPEYASAVGVQETADAMMNICLRHWIGKARWMAGRSPT